MYCCLFIHTPLMNTCFPAVMKKAAINIQAQVFFCRHVFSFLLSHGLNGHEFEQLWSIVREAWCAVAHGVAKS